MPSSAWPSQVRISPCCTTIRSSFGLRRERALLVNTALSRSLRTTPTAARMRCTSLSFSSSPSATSSSRSIALLGRGAVLAPAVAPLLAEDAGVPGMGVRVVRVELDGALDQAAPPWRCRRGSTGGAGAWLRARIRRRPCSRWACARRGRAPPPRRRPGSVATMARGDLVLEREDVLQVAVVALGPDVVVGFGIDQLHRDAHPVAGLAHAAFDDVLHAELARDLLHVHRLALVLERGVARDDEQVAEARQVGQDVLGQAVGEEFLLRRRRSCW